MDDFSQMLDNRGAGALGVKGQALAAQKAKRGAQLRLMNSTQFLYELRLAALEIEALSDGGKLSADLRAFRLRPGADTAPLLRQSAYTAEIDGCPSDYARLIRCNRTRSFNQYITHWFYPYKGKFHPQMVRALANIIGLYYLAPVVKRELNSYWERVVN